MSSSPIVDGKVVEKAYYNALYNVLFLLQLKIVKQYTKGSFPPHSLSDKFDEGLFKHYFSKLYKRLSSMDQHKTKQPLFSKGLRELACLLGIYEYSLDREEEFDYSEPKRPHHSRESKRSTSHFNSKIQYLENVSHTGSEMNLHSNFNPR